MITNFAVTMAGCAMIDLPRGHTKIYQDSYHYYESIR